MVAPPVLRCRAFEPDDLDFLRPWLRASGLGLPDGVASAAWRLRLVDDPAIVFRVACAADGSPNGFFRLDLAPDHTAELTLLVAPDRRRQGLGRALLEAALEEARRRGLRRLVALVPTHNRLAARFFAEAGFELSGQRVPGFAHMVRAVHRASRPPLEITP